MCVLKTFKILSKTETEFSNNSQECFLGDPLCNFFKTCQLIENKGARRQRTFFLYVSNENYKSYNASFLARLYGSTGRAIALPLALTLALVLAAVLTKMFKFYVKVYKTLYFLNPEMDFVYICMIIDVGPKFSWVLSTPLLMT